MHNLHDTSVRVLTDGQIDATKCIISLPRQLLLLLGYMYLSGILLCLLP